MARTAVRDRSDQRAEIARWEQSVSEWVAKREAAQGALARAEATSGEDVLEDPTLVAKTAGEMRAARDEIELATKAIDVAQSKLNAARVAVLEAEAKKLDEAAASAERKLSAHQAKTDELLAALEAHEGKFVPEVELMSFKRATGNLEQGTQWSFPRSQQMRTEVERERLRAAVVRDVAAGVDPDIRLRPLSDIIDSTVLGLKPHELYAPCVFGPAAVIRAPLHSRRIESVLDRLAQHDADAESDDDREISERQAVIDRIDAKEKEFAKSRRYDLQLTPADLQARRARIEWIKERKQWRADAPLRRKALLDELEALTGSRDPEQEPSYVA